MAFFDYITDAIVKINSCLNSIVWGAPAIILIITAGAVFTAGTGFFQFRRIGHVMTSTIGSTLKSMKRRDGRANTADYSQKSGKNTITQFQAVSGALAATIGTGNIAGVATAIMMGGPGAIFWMLISAVLGMMTIFAENVLGIYFRRKNAEGEWCGGPMYYIEAGLKKRRGLRLPAKSLATLFAVFCVCASFGIGNMTQVNTIAAALESSFSIPPIFSGIALAIGATLVILGGIKRIGAIAEKTVPVMALLYTAVTISIVFVNYREIPRVVSEILSSAFGVDAFTGAVSGVMVRQAVSMGFKRGVFSNEAGLGSSVIISCASDVKEPVVQGMWGIFQVFVDTILICSLTAFAILSTGVLGSVDGSGNLIQGAALVSEAFSTVFGEAAGAMLAVAIVLFAFSTVIGWSYLGEKAVEYIFGRRAVKPYKALFILFIVVGAVMELSLVWSISDTLNGLMALPNIIGLLSLSGLVIKITKNYIGRKLRPGGSGIKPMLSAYDE